MAVNKYALSYTALTSMDKSYLVLMSLKVGQYGAHHDHCHTSCLDLVSWFVWLRDYSDSAISQRGVRADLRHARLFLSGTTQGHGRLE